MSDNIVAKVEPKVNSLEDMPILVILPTRCYWLDMTDETDIPFQGEPQYGQELTAADIYGLEEARG